MNLPLEKEFELRCALAKRILICSVELDKLKTELEVFSAIAPPPIPAGQIRVISQNLMKNYDEVIDSLSRGV